MADSISSSALVAQFFRRDPALLANPSPAYRQLRDADPVLWVDGPPDGPPWLNAWHLFAYDDVSSGLRDPRFASRRQMAAMPLEHFGIDPTTPSARFFWTVQAQMMLTMDPPDHTRLRRLVLLAFTPRVVEGMRQEIQETVNDLLDATGDGFDVMADVAAPLPAIVIARMLGISPDDWPRFKRWSDGLIGFNVTQEKLDNFLELGDYLRERIAERRSKPEDDLISGLVAARDEDDVLTEDELVSQLIMLLVGGHETSTYAIGNAVYRLLVDRELWDKLPDNRIDLAVDELLRYDSPFQALARIVAVPVQIGRKVLNPGATVWLWIAAANRDPSQFADPERIDLERDPNRHLTFGLGPHYCLGAALARLELQITLATLRERFPTLRLATETVELRRDGAIRGPSQLRVDR